MHPMFIGTAIVAAAALFAIAGVLIAIITSKQKNRQAKLDFLRKAMESGAAWNPDLIDKVMRPDKATTPRKRFPRGQGALVAGVLVIAFGVGYAILAYLIGIASPEALLPMLGVASLFVCTGIGLLVVSRVLRSKRGDTDPTE